VSDNPSSLDLAYIGRALDRLTQEIAIMREQMTVQTASIIRLDATVAGQGAELRALGVAGQSPRRAPPPR
jgi:hypothetical protein